MIQKQASGFFASDQSSVGLRVGKEGEESGIHQKKDQKRGTGPRTKGNCTSFPARSCEEPSDGERGLAGTKSKTKTQNKLS